MCIISATIKSGTTIRVQMQRYEKILKCVLQTRIFLGGVGAREKYCDCSREMWYKQKKREIFISLSSVGIPGFEPGTPCSQSRCANRTALHPDWFVIAGAKVHHFFYSANFCVTFFTFFLIFLNIPRFSWHNLCFSHCEHLKL